MVAKLISIKESALLCHYIAKFMRVAKPSGTVPSNLISHYIAKFMRVAKHLRKYT